MAFLSSRTLIQAHSLFLFIVAVYLVVSPDAITDSDIVFILGEAMQIDGHPSLTTAQFPFAVCGILLISEALMDLIIVRKLPQLDDLLTPPEQRRDEDDKYPRRPPPPPSSTGSIINPFMVQMAGLYSEVWTFLAGARFCFFFGIAFFIYQSKPGSSFFGGLYHTTPQTFRYDDATTKLGLDQLKSRVVFTYVFMEMMFWLWTLSNIREERREVANRLAVQQAAERERGVF